MDIERHLEKLNRRAEVRAQPRYGCNLMQPVQAFATFPCFPFANTLDLLSIGITPPYKTSVFPPPVGDPPTQDSLFRFGFWLIRFPVWNPLKPCRGS